MNIYGKTPPQPDTDDVLFNNWFYHLQFNTNKEDMTSNSDMTHGKAEQVLNQPNNKECGTFLIWRRHSSIDQTIDINPVSLLPEHNLSIQTGEHCGIKIAHYHIRRLDEGGFFITRRAVFDTLKELMDYYRKVADGLCCRLRTPCSTPFEKPQLLPIEKFDDTLMEIPRELFTLDKRIDDGYFSSTWSGHFINDCSLPIAIKLISKRFAETEKGEEVTYSKMDRKLFFEMIHLFMLDYQLSHPNIVQLYGVCTSCIDPIFIVMELMPIGDLLNYLRWGDGRKLKVHQLVDISLQVAAAMSYLEEHSLVHSCLLTQKILLGPNNTCKLSAFGFPCLRQFYDMRIDGKDGPLVPCKFIAPEVSKSRDGDVIFNIKCDVWSFGMVLIDIFNCGRPMYNKVMTFKNILEFLDIGNCLPRLPNTPDTVHEIIVECLRQDPARRPYFKEIHYCLLNLLESQYMETI